jgi:hypothetical protein
MTHRRFLIGLLVAGCLAAAAVGLGAWIPLRAAAGLLLALFLPGLAATYAILPPDSEIDSALRFVLSLALSIAITIAVGLCLALSADHISRTAIAITLGLVNATALAIASRRIAADTPIDFEIPRVPAPLLVTTTVLLLLCTGLAVMALSVNSLPGEFTGLSLNRRGNDAQLLVENHQGRQMTYRYSLRGNGRVIASGLIAVADGDRRSIYAPIPPGTRSVGGLLFNRGPNPYRSVRMWVGGQTGRHFAQ